ncbi:DUF2066 domain-containing protein [Marinomonas communis]|uniref:DUF2066 domain-containing protein n=1 Tax=Marinomonas communis TaxID=28254 RepID=A0A4R6X9H9_9GAMM|nr:DUF2066 domain-containing protein [Marinomonas communis]MCC4274867.1 DUF2066 domain-containing protein [Marinomonas communis]TDR06827.1 hypothetical protein C8D85_3014 [Marinomonas communis]
MKRIVCLWLLMLSSLGHAVQVSNLYSAVVQVPASLDDRQLLNRAFNEAIDDVLARVSGQQQDISSRVTQKAHQSAASWVAQHSVQDVIDTIEGADGPEAAKEINVTFYKESVDSFLYDNDLPVWGENRPSILVWLIEDQSGQRQMFGANQPSSALSKLFDDAKHFGLPVYAPLVDATDRQTLSSSALWGFFEEDILAASQRYQTDVVLAIRLSEYRGEAVVESMLLTPNQSSRLISATKPTQQEAVEEVLVRLAALLSDRYASIKTLTPQEMYVQVDGVRNYTAMSTLRQYISSMGIVKQVQLKSIVEGQVGLDILLNGTPEKFANTVALNSVLSSSLQTAGMTDPLLNSLHYQYTGKGKIND